MTLQFRNCPVSCPIAASAQPQRRWHSWALSAATTALVLSAASAVALTSAAPRAFDQPIFLTLPPAPAAAESLAAISDPAPIASVEAPNQIAPKAPEADTRPDMPTAQSVSRPKAPTQPAPEPMADAKPTPPIMPMPPRDPLPAPDAQPAAADRPPAPEPQETAKPEVKRAAAKPKQVENKPAKTKRAKPQTTKKPTKAGTAAANSGGATASAKAAKAAAQGPSPAAYQKAVMKKIKATQKRGNAGKGHAVVGFAISASGGLSVVKIVKSSGSAALDAAAVDHIKRAAPFPAPPAEVAARFSFEFIGK